MDLINMFLRGFTVRYHVNLSLSLLYYESVIVRCYYESVIGGRCGDVSLLYCGYESVTYKHRKDMNQYVMDFISIPSFLRIQ